MVKLKGLAALVAASVILNLSLASQDGECSTDLDADCELMEWKEEWVPKRWRGTIKATQHQIDATKEYPKRETMWDIVVDTARGISKVQVLKGRNEGQVLVRNVSQKREYKLFLGRCESSILLDNIPPFEFPKREAVKRLGSQKWQFEQNQQANGLSMGFENVIFEANQATGLLSKVYVEFVGSPEPDDRLPLTSYELLDLEPLQASDTDNLLLEIQKLENSKSCSPNSGGWPWTMVLHTYVRV